MKVLVTGATGFLGSHVVEVLLEHGHEVVALVRATSDVAFLEERKVELRQASLETGEGLAEALSGMEAVVHSAGVVKARSAEEFNRVNAEGSANLVRAAAQVEPKLRRFVYISSLAAHGPSSEGNPRDPAADAAPVTHYGRSKLAGELAVLSHKDQLPITVIRPPAIYGPRDKEMFAFFKSVSRRLVPLIGKENTASVIYGADCARAVVAALEKDHPSGRIYFVDDGRIYTWSEMGRALQDALEVRALPVRVPAAVFTAAAYASELYGKFTRQSVMLTRDKLNELRQPHWVCESQAIQKELGWRPSVDFYEGARETAQWYRIHGWL